MSYTIHPQCSPRAQKLVGVPSPHLGKPPKYPFDLLQVGQCFTVPTTHVKLHSLRVEASRNSVRGGPAFRVLLHDDIAIPCYEVVRVL